MPWPLPQPLIRAMPQRFWMSPRPATQFAIQGYGDTRPNHLEEVELRYETITWSYKDGNIIHKDTWNERS